MRLLSQSSVHVLILFIPRLLAYSSYESWPAGYFPDIQTLHHESGRSPWSEVSPA